MVQQSEHQQFKGPVLDFLNIIAVPRILNANSQQLLFFTKIRQHQLKLQNEICVLTLYFNLFRIPM